MALMKTACLGTEFMCDYTKHSFWKENAEKVCEDEEDIRGKIVIVTGSNTGIGKQAALQLTKRGARVIMAVRNTQKGEEALEDIKKQLEGREVTVEIMKLDLGDLQSVRDFVKNFESKYDHLDILVNNAGLTDPNPVLQKTKDGFEQHIGVNHLGPFLLTRLLLPFLQKSPTPSRLVCVESTNVAVAPLNFMDDLMMEKKVRTGDHGMEQYSISKLCSAICNTKLAEDYDLLGDGHVRLFQLCPGLVKSDGFRNTTGCLNKIRVGIQLGALGVTTHQGCETVTYCAVSKSLLEADKSGKGDIFRFKKIWTKGSKAFNEYLDSPEGMETTNKLYELSENLVGLTSVKNGN